MHAPQSNKHVGRIRRDAVIGHACVVDGASMADYAALIRPTWFRVTHAAPQSNKHVGRIRRNAVIRQCVRYTASDNDVKLKSRTRIAGINSW